MWRPSSRDGRLPVRIPRRPHGRKGCATKKPTSQGPWAHRTEPRLTGGQGCGRVSRSRGACSSRRGRCGRWAKDRAGQDRPQGDEDHASELHGNNSFAKSATSAAARRKTQDEARGQQTSCRLLFRWASAVLLRQRTTQMVRRKLDWGQPVTATFGGRKGGTLAERNASLTRRVQKRKRFAKTLSDILSYLVLLGIMLACESPRTL